MNPILELYNVSYSYHTPKGETKALSDISFSVMSGTFTSVVGPSGCGKSTLLSLISGLLMPDSGDIYICGSKACAPSKGLSSMRIGYMLQKDNLFEWLSVYKNVCLGLEMQHKMTPENLKKTDEMLKAYGLDAFRNAKPSELSGGMRQRAALIRTLALEPDILLLDEPFSALDYQTRLNVSDDIGKILKARNKTAILVTHDISEAVSMGDRVIILTDRPATINKIIDINLSIPERTPFTSRSAPEFGEYFSLIWKELQK